MSKYRTAIRFLFIAVLALPLSAFAANYDVKALIDTDNSRSTGCPVVLPDGTVVTGIDTVLTTSVTVTGNTGTVTSVTRQTCVSGFLSGPVPVDNGWNVGVSPTGDLLIESHLGPNVVTMNNVGTPRFVFTTTTGSLFDTLVQPTTTGGGDIVMRQAGRDHAVATRPLRTIVLDGSGSDWAGDVPLAKGTDNHPALRFISVNGYAGLNDLYFNFQIHTNPAAPTAHDDVYDLPTLGGTLSVATLGVLNNDDPNGQSISAVQVDNPQHGTVVLSANGGFVYSNDGAHVQQDQFHYFANGNLPSNIATVTIDMPGTKYVFTSADHVTFTSGVSSSFTVTVTGKPTPALSEDGTLPLGITFVDNGDGTATLSGVPARGTVGTYPLVFHAEKNKPHQADQPFTLTVICGALTVINPAQSSFPAGVPMSAAFDQGGGADPITWSETGALPPGLTFNTSTGILSGTPTSSGTFPITVTATDSSGCTGTGQPYNLVITCPAITVTNPVVNTGTVNVAFSQTFTQAGGFGTTTFSLFSGTLPAGLTLNPSTGVLSGTPTQTGTFHLVVRATDSHGCTGNGPTYNLTIGCQVITVTNPATNTGTVNTAFSQTFTASNTIPAVTFSLNSGTLPAGLTLSSGGVLSGTPTQTGSFPITVKATDANGCTGTGATYTLTIACQVITVTNPATNTGTVNTAFSKTFTAGNTVGTVVFTLNSGTLPAGLTLSSGGVLSGTPTQTGSFPITVKATDANGCFGIGATYTLTIGCQVITVNNPATTSGTVNVAFSQTFTASNAIGATTFTTASTLPAGLTLSTGGVLSGTPTQSGTFPIVVHVVDANGCSGNGATYNLVIGCQVITVGNPATATGTVNVAFSQSFTSGNTIGTVTYATASALPTGLSLSTAGVLSGTPTQSGSFPIVVTATDANGCSGSGATYTLVIGCQVISVTNPATNTGTVNTVFGQTFTASNTIGTVTFSTASPLPAGLVLSSGGVLSGTPTQTGSFPIVVTATDANGCSGSGATYTLTIGCQVISVTNPATTTGTVNTAFSQSFTAGNTVGTVSFTTASTLPAGLSLSTAGVLSGTPTQTGSFGIVVTATDGNGCSGSGTTYTLVIGCQTITVTNPATNTGTVSAPFTVTFTSGNTIGTVTYTTASTLPAGITLATNGTLAGTPTQSGTFPIVVTATDANGCSGNGATYNLVIGCQVITVGNPATMSSPAGTPLSINFTQTGAIGTATFTTASTLPTGLTLATNGTLSGTPTQGGAFPIVVTVTDSNGCTGTNPSYTLTVTCPTITVTNPGVTTGTVNVAFSQTFTQTGGIGTTTFALLSGTLPTGLSLASNGTLSGTPTQKGSFPIVVRATDSNGCTGDGATYTLVIGCQVITVTNPATTTGTVNTVFGQTFTAGNTIGTVTFTTASTLPAGLTLSAGGVLSGTPTQTGSFPIVVTATDVNGCSGTGATYTLVISCQVISVTNPVNNAGTVSAPFSETFTAGNTIGTVTFSLNSGTLPAGLSLSAGGVLSGTPTQSGSFPITVKATDANLCFGVSATYTITIACQTITVTNPVNNTGTVSAPFSETFTSANTIGSVTYTLNSGTLPAGLSLSTGGILGGTPTQSGSFPITVKATDSNGCFGISATYTLTINCQTITVTNPATTSGPAGTPFSVTFTQTGGIGTITFSETGALPTGLTFHTGTGVLDGTPTQGGTFPITVTATDSNGCTGTGATYSLTITCPVITVTNPGVSTGTAGTAFSQTFTQSGGQGTITWSETGTLPTGILLNTSSGVLSGTTSQVGTFPITVTATDQNGCTGTGATYNLTFNCQTVTVTNPGVNTGTVDAAFSQTFTVTGILGTVTWSETGALPAGITLNSASGVLSGTPSVPGSFPITVKATDTNGCFGTSSYTLTINCQTITVTKPVTTTGTVNAPFSQTFTQTGVGTHTPATFTLNSGSLPAGLTLSTAGVLSGTPTVPGSFPITVKVTDANGCFGVSTTYTLVIACQTITVTNPVTTTGTVGVAFSQTFTQSGAQGTATFTTASTLPTGFTLSTAGVLSGTTNQHNTFPITVTVTDSNGCTGTSATYNLVINCQTITVTNPGVTTGTVGTPFGQTFTQTGGIGTTTFSTASTLPTGLTLSSAGLLSGTPLQPGSFPIVVTATDSNGCTGTGSTYTLVIACNVINVTNPGVSTGTVDAAFSQTFTQTGGNGTITWSKTGAIPAGMTFHTTTGVLDGTPTVPGSFPITVTATDANGCSGTGSTYTLVIACQTITVNNPGVTTGTVDAPFSQSFTQTGVGTHTPATFTLNSGSLAGTGLTLSSAGVLSGTPSAPGSIVITVKVTDANGCTGISATYTLVIACQTITVTNPVTTTGVFNTAFSQTFTQTGVGTHTPAVFTINSGTLPTGLTLSSAGVLSGTPTQTGTFPITVKVTDANGCTGIGATYNLAITPNVGNDAYGTVNALVDNTQAYVTGGATATPGTPAVSLTGSVLGNDLPAGGVTVTSGVFGTTAGGSVTIQTDGTFLYTPKANPGAAATTSDSFTYTGTSNTGGTATPTSAVGTVTLTLANRVWYVSNNGGGVNGQSQSPFTTLAAAAAASTANDIIFVYNGDGTTTNQSAGITLKSGQQLLGEINGLTVNTYALVAVGARPSIRNTGGDGITVPATAGSLTNVIIKGLTVSGTANGINISSSGANTLSATVDNVVVSNAAANNGIKIAAGSSTSSTVTVQNSTVSAAVQNGIDAQQTVAGALILNINNNTITATATGININGAGSTSTTITNFASNNVTGNTGGSGITVASAIFDGTPGGAFQTVSGGSTVVGAVGNAVGAAGMVLTNVSGDLSFTDLDIVSGGGAGLLASGTTPYTGSAGFQITVTGSGAGSVDATGGPAVDLTTVTANLPWGTIKSTNSASTGVSLVTVPGTFTTTGGTSSITNATSTDFNISGSNATVTYDGTIVDTTGRAVAIASTTGGTKTLSGAITNNGGTGISLTTNTGATINFTGTIILSTGSSDAFTATGGGTVSATDANSTLTTTTGIALNVTDTIGAADLKFKSITAGTAASGPSNGIILNGTGNAGGLIVTGTGSAGGGGTIQKTTGAGISLTSVGDSASFTDMNITNPAGDGITAATVKNFTCSLCVITNPGTSANHDGIRMTEASGTATLTNVTVTGATTDGVNITNQTATLTSLAISGGSLSSTNNAFATADSGLIVIAKGTGVITAATVSGVTFNANFSSALQSFAQDTATIGDITVSGCTFTNNGAAAADFDAGTGTGNIKFHFLNNTTITGNKGPVVNVFSSATATGGLIQGRIDGNVIGTNAVTDSGSTGGAGIRVFLQGTAGNITINNNTIRSTACSRGIEVQTLGPVPGNGSTRVSDIVITGNNVNNFSSDCSFPLNDIFLSADKQDTTSTTLRADIHGNTIKTAGATPANTDFDFTNTAWLFFMRNVATATAQLADFNGPHANANAAIAANQTSGSAKTDGNVALIAAGSVTVVP